MRRAFPLAIALSAAGCSSPAERARTTARHTVPSTQAGPAAPILPAPPAANPVAAPLPAWDWFELERPRVNAGTPAFSADGKLIAVVAKDGIGVWALETRKPVTRILQPDDVPDPLFVRHAFTADGKQLVSLTGASQTVRFWDVATGKQVREWDRPKTRYHGLSPCGGFLVDQVEVDNGRASQLRVIDLPSGESRFLDHKGDWRFHPVGMAVSPDGKAIAVQGPRDGLRTFDPASGKLLREYQPGNPPPPDRRVDQYYDYVKYSADGRFLMTRETKTRWPDEGLGRLVIWGVADGRRYCEVRRWGEGYAGGSQIVGGRLLMQNSSEAYDLLTDEVRPFDNPGIPPQYPYWRRYLRGAAPAGGPLVFTGPNPDEQTMAENKQFMPLAAAPSLPPPFPAGEWTDEMATKAWVGVVGNNLFRREHCEPLLKARPDAAVKVARANLKPVPSADADRVAALVADLDPTAPMAAREKAMTGLRELAYRFEPALAAALKDARGERQTQLATILKQVRETPVPADLAADLRGVEFLRALDTPAAREHLKTLAAGAVGARLTVAAAAK